MTPDETGQIMHMIKAAWKRPPMSDDTAEVYVYAISDLDFEMAKAAVLDLMASSKWMPAISEIRGAALAISTNTRTAGEAWAEVTAAFGSGGVYGYVPEWSDEIIGRAVEAMGGFRLLCFGDNLMADRAHFLKIYDTLAQRRQYDRLRLPESRRLALEAKNGQAQLRGSVERIPESLPSTEVRRNGQGTPTETA